MKPVDQTIFGKGGNCLAACIASIFEYPLQDVPNFCGDYDDNSWFHALNDWLLRQGFVAVMFKTQEAVLDHLWLRGAFCIVSGTTERGLSHATVWQNEKCVHDPHPSRAGLLEIEDVIVFVSLNPANHLSG